MKGKNRGFKISLLLIIASFILIGSGIYVGYVTTPKRVFQTSIKSLTNSINFETVKEKVTVAENFTLESAMKINATSEYLTKKSTLDQDYLKYVNLLKNLNNTDNQLAISKDNKNKELLLTINSSLKNQPLLNQKYYIKEATEYYYVAGLKNTYINNGNNNYFESSANFKTPKENINYLFNFIITSLKNNIHNKYFTTSQIETTIDNKKRVYNKVSLGISNKNINEIILAIKEDLQNDKIAHDTLNKIPYDFQLFKKTGLLSSNDEIILNIYTDRIKYKAYKYELILKKDEKNITINYELPNNQGTILKNNELLYTYTIDRKNSGLKINIFSEENVNIGYIVLSNTDNYQEIVLDFNDKNLNILINYQNELKELERNYSYSHLNQFNLRIINNNLELINLNYTIDTIIKNETSIAEDISTSIFKSSVTDLERENYSKQLIDNFNKLYQ